MRWRMDAAGAKAAGWGGLIRLATERPDYVEAVYNEVRERGLMSASELDDPGAKSGPWWGWRHGKQALEYLFWSGRLSARRRSNFERVYDLTERLIPPAWFDAPVPTQVEAHKALLVRAARAHGIGTAARPCRLLPAQHPVLATLAGGARGGGAAGAGTGRRLEPTRVHASRGAHTARDRRACAALAVRLARLGTIPHRARLRLSLPPGDLHAEAQADLRLLRPSLPARRRAGRPGGREGRAVRRRAARAGCVCRARSQPDRRSPGRWPRSSRSSAAGSGSTASSSTTTATSPPPSAAPPDRRAAVRRPCRRARR